MDSQNWGDKPQFNFITQQQPGLQLPTSSNACSKAAGREIVRKKRYRHHANILCLSNPISRNERLKANQT